MKLDDLPPMPKVHSVLICFCLSAACLLLAGALIVLVWF